MSVALQTVDTPTTDLARIGGLADRLREAFDRGKTRDLAWRRAQLDKLAALCKENADELVAALQKDLGKPTLEAFTTDIAFVIAEIDLARKNLARWTKPEKVRTPLVQQLAKARVVREPLGVVLIIAPWNYPVQLLLGPLVGALAAGNCAVLKPSEITANTSAVLAPGAEVPGSRVRGHRRGRCARDQRAPRAALRPHLLHRQRGSGARDHGGGRGAPDADDARARWQEPVHRR